MQKLNNFTTIFKYLVLLLYTAILSAAPREYQIDLKPFEKFTDNYARYRSLAKKFETGPLTIPEHYERIKILDQVISKKPAWLDGYWLLASESFIIASTLPNPAKNPEVLEVLQTGMSKLEVCLAKDGDHPLCNFFKASLAAKLASIKGVFASLKAGKQIRDTWLKTLDENIQFSFRPNVSLIGSAYYGLGLFYRLVPDSVLIDWLWDIRGNKKQSVTYHRKAVEIDTANPCSLLMLAVAILCAEGDDKGSKSLAEAQEIFSRIDKIAAIDGPQEACKRDSFKVRSNTGRVCGYTQAQYQEEKE